MHEKWIAIFKKYCPAAYEAIAKDEILLDELEIFGEDENERWNKVRELEDLHEEYKAAFAILAELIPDVPFDSSDPRAMAKIIYDVHGANQYFPKALRAVLQFMDGLEESQEKLADSLSNLQKLYGVSAVKDMPELTMEGKPVVVTVYEHGEFEIQHDGEQVAHGAVDDWLVEWSYMDLDGSDEEIENLEKHILDEYND